MALYRNNRKHMDVLWTLVDKCAEIRSDKNRAKEVHLRGCRIGQNVDFLKAWKDLVGAQIVSVLTAYNVIGYVPVVMSSAAEHAKKKPKPTGRRRIPECPSSITPRLKPLLLDVKYDTTAHKSNTDAAIDDQKQLFGWATKYFGHSGAKANSDKLYISVMYTELVQTFHCAGERGYVAQLVTV